VGKITFHHVWPPLEKILGNPLEKSTIGSPWKKFFRRPCLEMNLYLTSVQRVLKY